jgi:hypothetical protein
MANNYRQFVVSLGSLTPEEIAWWVKMKAALRALPDERVDDAEESDDEFIRLAEDIGFSDYGDNTNIVGNLYIADDYATILAEEFGDVDAASELISAFLKAHKPTEYVILSWADTCSKMRSGEFGGGECLITGDWVYFPPDLLTDMGEAYAKAKTAGKTPSAEDVLESVKRHHERTEP